MVGLLLVGAVTLTGCGSEASPAPPPPIAVNVSEATWTDGPWPLLVSEGVLRCRYSYQVTFTANGQEYALNAKAVKSGDFGDIAAITPPRSRDPIGFVEINGDRQPVWSGPDTSRLSNRGLDLCA
jgi:hypothetical protein